MQETLLSRLSFSKQLPLGGSDRVAIATLHVRPQCTVNPYSNPTEIVQIRKVGAGEHETRIMVSGMLIMGNSRCDLTHV